MNKVSIVQLDEIKQLKQLLQDKTKELKAATKKSALKERDLNRRIKDLISNVTLADAIIQKGRFKCKFDDGSFACIKPCNLQLIHGDRVNQKTNRYEKDSSSNLDKKGDQSHQVLV